MNSLELGLAYKELGAAIPLAKGDGSFSIAEDNGEFCHWKITSF